MSNKQKIIIVLFTVFTIITAFHNTYITRELATNEEVAIHAKKARLKQLQDEITSRSVPDNERIEFVDHAEEIMDKAYQIVEYQNTVLKHIEDGNYANEKIAKMFDDNEVKKNLPWYYTSENVRWKVNKPVQIDGVKSENEVVFYCVNDHDEIYSYATSTYDPIRGIFTVLDVQVTSLGNNHSLAE